MSKIKQYSIFAGALIFILIAIIVWNNYHSDDLVDQYKVETLHRGEVKQVVSANGTLNPVTLVNVGTQISGQVEKIYADFNDHVKAGQTLLKLDSTLLVAQLNQSKAQLAKANANFKFAKANAERGFPLQKKGFISKQDWEQLVQLQRSAEADLGLAKAQIAHDEINLNYATIRSPVSGVVVDREVDVGQTVASSFQTPTLFKIAQDLRKMQIGSSFAEADIANIAPSQ
jgi:HlyD family secretion protein